MFISVKVKPEEISWWKEVIMCVPQPGLYYLRIKGPGRKYYTGLTVEYMDAIIMHRQYMD